MKQLICASMGIAALVAGLDCNAAATNAFNQQQICRATMGAVMGRDPKTIKFHKVEAGVIHVSYTRPEDGTVWGQRCRIEGTRVIWATSSGRWRDQSTDEVISYGVTPTAATITQKFSDGSSVAKTYTRAELQIH